jgi:hypothetical protein
MGWIVALITLAALVALAFYLRLPQPDKGWRDQAEGLREQVQREEVRRA